MFEGSPVTGRAMHRCIAIGQRVVGNMDLGDHDHPTSKTGSFSSLKISFGTITDLQDKYCGNCYDIYLIQSHYKRNHKRGHLFCGGGQRPPPLNIGFE